MTSRDFCYWLQGYFEIGSNQPRPAEWVPSLNSEQLKIIRNHLNMVFKHEIDPSHGDSAHQKVLSDAHKGVDSPNLMGSGSTITSSPLDFTKIYNC